MIIDELVCPVCKNSLSYKEIEVDQRFMCLMCASKLIVTQQEERIKILILENANEIVWAPPMAWSEERKSMYYTKSEIGIKHAKWAGEIQRTSVLIASIMEIEDMPDFEKRKRIIILEKDLLETLAQLDNDLKGLENNLLTA